MVRTRGATLERTPGEDPDETYQLAHELLNMATAAVFENMNEARDMAQIAVLIAIELGPDNLVRCQDLLIRSALTNMLRAADVELCGEEGRHRMIADRDRMLHGFPVLIRRVAENALEGRPQVHCAMASDP